MKFIISVFKRYPGHSSLTLVAMLFAGIAEGFGMSMLLPLLGLSAGGGTAVDGTAHKAGSALERAVTGLFSFLGMEPTTGILLIIFVVSIIIKVLLMLLANGKVGYMVAKVATDLRLSLLRTIFSSNWSCYVHQPGGSITNSFATEATRSADAYLFGMRFLSMLMNVAVYTAVALLVAWKVTILAVIIGSGILYMLRFMVKQAKKAGRDQTILLKSLLSFLTDILLLIKPLKAMAREQTAEKILQEKTLDLKEALQRQVFSKEALRALQEPLITIFFAVGLYLAMVLFRLPLSNVLVMVYMLAKILKALQRAQKEHQSMVIVESAYWSLLSRIEESQEKKEEFPGRLTPRFQHAISLSDITMSYRKRPVLKGFSMEIKKGSFTALVGPSGAGKTTVVDLITGLFQPQEGRILIDAIPLRDINLRKWREMTGYVPQETFLLHDTVLFNVNLGDETISEEDVTDALKKAGAWEFVSRMPQGIHSVVGERGGLISGGQRQRITIARALVKRPSLLIMDEATNALDPETEFEICRTLRGLRASVTVLAISHQASILKEADTAYMLENGRARILKKEL